MEGALVVLAVLACPVGMGLMMWFMGRNAKGGEDQTPQESASLDDLRAEQRRIAAQIDRIEEERAGNGQLSRR